MMRQTQRRYNQDVGVHDLYDYYSHLYFKEKFLKKNGELSKKSIVHKNSKYNIGSSLYHKILKDFHKMVVNDVLSGEDFIIPERLGIIGIRKNKTIIKTDEEGNVITNAPINYKATLDLWEKDPKAKENKKIIRHINEHTNRYVHRWYWNKYDANFRNKTAYSFIPTRTNKRLLAKVLNDEDSSVDFYTRFSKGKKF